MHCPATNQVACIFDPRASATLICGVMFASLDAFLCVLCNSARRQPFAIAHRPSNSSATQQVNSIRWAVCQYLRLCATFQPEIGRDLTAARSTLLKRCGDAPDAAAVAPLHATTVRLRSAPTQQPRFATVPRMPASHMQPAQSRQLREGTGDVQQAAAMRQDW